MVLLSYSGTLGISGILPGVTKLIVSIIVSDIPTIGAASSANPMAVPLTIPPKLVSE